MKDRDLSQDSSISKNTRTPARVGLVGSALLAGSALVAACGGGAKSATTPEGEVGGAQYNPTTGSSIEMKTVIASPTAKVEAPTVAPTATAASSEVMTPQQLLEAGTQINGLFTQAFEGLDISAIASKIPQPSERDPQYIQNAVNICIGAAPYPYRDAAEKQRMDQNPVLLFTGVSNFCGVAGEASLGLYNALEGNPEKQAQFKDINMRVEKMHHSLVRSYEAKDSRVTESYWSNLKGLYYPFGATGTSN